MSVAIGLLRSVPQVAGIQRGAEPSKLLAGLHRLATEVEESWESFSEEQREALKAFAYMALEPPRDIKTRLTIMMGRISMAFRVLRGDEEETAQLVLAMHRLIHAVLEAVEREHPSYVAKLSERLNQLDSANLDRLPAVPDSEFERRAWLEKLLD